jgi:hypothetical protein
LAVVNGFLLRSRETHVRRAEQKSLRIQQLNKQIKQQQKTLEQRDEQLAKKDAEIVRLKAENERLRKQPVSLPEDPPLPHHTFGPRMISLCVNLARRIGLRAIADVLAVFLEWLGVSVKLPTWSCIRTWLLRAGVAALQRPVEAAEDWIWMADHSNQIGQEKVLSIIGLRASHMPPAGETIRHDHIRVLELVPGTQWKRDDVARVYEHLAQRCGAPAAVLVDGAVELREGAEVLQKHGRNSIVLRDFKHHASNLLKKTLESDERFAEFSTQIARTRSAIQQTELAHFTPPGPRPKARFMNLAPQLRWAEMGLWQLSHPDSRARHGITAERMNQKLGWLSAFRDDIARWNACQDIVSTSVTWINEQGLSRGTSRRLRDHLRNQRGARSSEVRHSCCRKLTAKLLRFVCEQESKLVEDQRLPLSTEILESSFGLFKQLERQHSKGGLTSLLAAYGCLLHTATPESIRADFERVSVKAMRAWVRENLGKTLTSKRQTAYHEFRHTPT